MIGRPMTATWRPTLLFAVLAGVAASGLAAQPKAEQAYRAQLQRERDGIAGRGR